MCVWILQWVIFLLHMNIQMFQQHLLKGLFPLDSWLGLSICLKYACYIERKMCYKCKGFRTLSSVPLIKILVLMPPPHHFHDCSFVVSCKIRKGECSGFVLLFYNTSLFMFLVPCVSGWILFWTFRNKSPEWWDVQWEDQGMIHRESEKQRRQKQ